MIKKIFSLAIITLLASCQSDNEAIKTAKARAASERINNSANNSKDAFKEFSKPNSQKSLDLDE